MKRFTVFLVTATLASLSYVHLEVETVKIGYQIRKLQERKMQALDRGRSLKYNIASLKSPSTLEKKLQLKNIQLEAPKTWNTLVLPGALTAAKRNEPLPMVRPPFFTKFLIGTAQAEAKET